MRRTSLLSALLLTACAGSPANHIDEKPPKGPVTELWVSPDGNDAHEGTREAPKRTIVYALTEDVNTLRLLPGVFVEPSVVITKSIAVLGPTRAEGRAVLDGYVLISADDVTLERVDVIGGIAINQSLNVMVSTASVTNGLRDDSISITSSRARLRNLNIGCGAETCVQVTTATASLEGLTIAPVEASKRGIRVDTSSATIHGLRATGASITQVQAGLRSTLRIYDSVLSRSRGNGLAVLQGSALWARGVTVEHPDRIGLLVQGSTARFENGTIEGTGSIGVGVTGADVQLVECTLGSSRDGSVSVGKHSGRLSNVRLSGGRLEHGVFPGALVSGGTLEVDGTHFVGDPGAAGGDLGGDAIVASSLEAQVIVRSALIESPMGYGVSFNNDAFGTVTATIVMPRVGGVAVDTVAVEPVIIRGARITACQSGSGVNVLASRNVTVEATRIEGCSEAGVLVGQGSDAQVIHTVASNNSRYAFAAFGGSTMDLDGSTARGSPWAAFAACGDGSRIVRGLGNVLKGQVSDCP